MPVRNMLYDGLTYTEQIRRLHELQKNEKEYKLTRDEFLSKFRKNDKISPVITIVLYYGEDAWDASLDLYGLFHEEALFRENEMLRQYISNYKINLVEPGKMDTYHVIREFLHSEKVLKAIDEGKREETVDMCKALQDLYDEGIEKGIKEGMALEKLDIAKKLLDILTPEMVAEKVGLPVEAILRLKEEQ